MTDELSTKDIENIRRTYEQVSARGWGLAVGVLAALGLFLATVILLIRGGADPGPHLGLLRVYFPGYDVSWPGAFIGSFYAFLIGYAAGRAVGAIYNRIVDRL